jgi:hypothetical protein
MEKENRIEKMKITHPKLYKFLMEKLDYELVLDWYLHGEKYGQ